MDLIENIKDLYENHIFDSNKEDYKQKVAIEFNVAPSTVRTGWFIRFEIPSRYKVQENLIVFTQKYIANQKEEV